MSSSASELFSCTIQRKLRGVELNIKSQPIEEVMLLVSAGRVSRPSSGETGAAWGNVPHYIIDVGANGIPIAFSGFTAGRFDLWGSRELILNRAPALNLSMLLAVGLREGVSLTIPTVLSDAQMSQFTDGPTGLKSAVRQFFIDFLKDSVCSFRITTEEI